MNETDKPGFLKLVLYFAFSVAVSVICGAALGFTAVMFFDFLTTETSSIKTSIVGLSLHVLSYGSGAFVLGTLLAGRFNRVWAALIYISPSICFRAHIFASAAYLPWVKDDLLAHPFTMIIMPIVYLLIAPFVSYYFMGFGEHLGETFDKPRSILNIHWKHWLWILPFYLFQVVAVSTYLLLALWNIDLATADIPLLIFHLPAFMSRIIVFFILVGMLWTTNVVYQNLSGEDTGPGWLRFLKVMGCWIIITVACVLIFLAYVGR